MLAWVETTGQQWLVWVHGFGWQWGYIGGILLVDISWWLAVCNCNEIKDDVRIIALRDTSGLSRIHRRWCRGPNGLNLECWDWAWLQLWGNCACTVHHAQLAEGKKGGLAHSKMVWALGDEWGQEENLDISKWERGCQILNIWTDYLLQETSLKYLGWHGGECLSWANISVVVDDRDEHHGEWLLAVCCVLCIIWYG